MNAEAKHQQGFQFQFHGFMLYNCNSLPNFGGDKGQHVFDRFIIISCDNPLPESERDAGLIDKLKSECGAVASLSIEYLRSAVERGYKFTESERVLANRENYVALNNSLVTFVKERCELWSDRTTVRQFNSAYQLWCMANDLYTEKKHDIKCTLKDMFGIEEKKSGDRYYELKLIK